MWCQLDEWVTNMLMLSLRINMYSEGLIDLMQIMMGLPFSTDPKAVLDTLKTKAQERYLPVFEKV